MVIDPFKLPTPSELKETIQSTAAARAEDRKRQLAAARRHLATLLRTAAEQGEKYLILGHSSHPHELYEELEAEGFSVTYNGVYGVVIRWENV